MTEKIAAGINYCIAGSLCAGGILDWLQHLDWNRVAVIGGFVIGLVTYLTQTYFDWRRTRAYEKGIDAGIITAPPIKRGLFSKGRE
ncbi:phage holin [Gibbsiella quercinecans]|uniref:phage holin n=1 Tax=Gibbsiella quercinecans TaxID=929813 RepID=UPI003A4E4570